MTRIIPKLFLIVLPVIPVFAADVLPPVKDRDYRESMRQFVIEISSCVKSVKPGFLVIPQNGLQLLTLDGSVTGPPASNYIRAIDGIGCEELFYGYDGDDRPTPVIEQNRMTAFLETARRQGLRILVTDYCTNRKKVDDSYGKNAARNYLSFAAERRDLDGLPSYPRSVPGPNQRDIRSLSDASNFLYIINPADFPDKRSLLNALRNTDYDLIILDLFFDAENPLTIQDIRSIRKKKSGGNRILIAYLSIGEAEDYRYYWKSSWRPGRPRWIEAQNPDWEGNFRIRYWDPEWQQIITGKNGSYVRKIIDSGFDGVYLDLVDAYENFE